MFRNVECDRLAHPEPRVVQRRDQRVVVRGEIRRTRLDGRASHRVDLVRLYPGSRFLLSLGFDNSVCFAGCLL